MINIHGSGLPHSNPNLLDNWWFRNPVNQHGKTVYTSNGNSIDRWTNWENGRTVALTSDGIRIDKGSLFVQTIEAVRLKGVKEVTLSALLHSGRLAFNFYNSGVGDIINTAYLSDALCSTVVKIPEIPDDSIFRFTLRSDSDDTVISAVKLELGSVSTLAYDAPPNYQQELAKCQRYQQYYKPASFVGRASSANAAQFKIPLSVPMRAVPALVDGDVSNWRVQDYAGAYKSITSIALYSDSLDDAYITLSVNSDGAFAAGQIYTLSRVSSAGGFYLDANIY